MVSPTVKLPLKIQTQLSHKIQRLLDLSTSNPNSASELNAMSPKAIGRCLCCSLERLNRLTIFANARGGRSIEGETVALTAGGTAAGRGSATARHIGVLRLVTMTANAYESAFDTVAATQSL